MALVNEIMEAEGLRVAETMALVNRLHGIYAYLVKDAKPTPALYDLGVTMFFRKELPEDPAQRKLLRNFIKGMMCYFTYEGEPTRFQIHIQLANLRKTCPDYVSSTEELALVLPPGWLADEYLAFKKKEERAWVRKIRIVKER